jgi:hypothetical protein
VAWLVMVVPAVVPAASALCDINPSNIAPTNSAMNPGGLPVVVMYFILLLLKNYCLKITAC